jgi:hypothetical protein
MAKSPFDRVDGALVFVGILLLLASTLKGVQDVGGWYGLCWIGWFIAVINRCVTKWRNPSN